MLGAPREKAAEAAFLFGKEYLVAQSPREGGYITWWPVLPVLFGMEDPGHRRLVPPRLWLAACHLVVEILSI